MHGHFQACGTWVRQQHRPCFCLDLEAVTLASGLNGCREMHLVGSRYWWCMKDVERGRSSVGSVPSGVGARRRVQELGFPLKVKATSNGCFIADLSPHSDSLLELRAALARNFDLVDEERRWLR